MEPLAGGSSLIAASRSTAFRNLLLRHGSLGGRGERSHFMASNAAVPNAGRAILSQTFATAPAGLPLLRPTRGELRLREQPKATRARPVAP